MQHWTVPEEIRGGNLEEGGEGDPAGVPEGDAAVFVPRDEQLLLVVFLRVCGLSAEQGATCHGPRGVGIQLLGLRQS